MSQCQAMTKLNKGARDVQITHLWGDNDDSHPHRDTSGLLPKWRGSLVRAEKECSLLLINSSMREKKKCSETVGPTECSEMAKLMV